MCVCIVGQEETTFQLNYYWAAVNGQTVQLWVGVYTHIHCGNGHECQTDLVAAGSNGQKLDRKVED